jgi:hypothetical protein
MPSNNGTLYRINDQIYDFENVWLVFGFWCYKNTRILHNSHFSGRFYAKILKSEQCGAAFFMQNTVFSAPPPRISSLPPPSPETEEKIGWLGET